jgi:hypothetical protein
MKTFKTCIIFVTLAISNTFSFGQCATSMDKVFEKVPNDKSATSITFKNYPQRVFQLVFHVGCDTAKQTTASLNDIEVLVENTNAYYQGSNIVFKIAAIDTVFDYNYRLINNIEECHEIINMNSNSGFINVFIADTLLISGTSAEGYCPEIISQNYSDWVFLSSNTLKKSALAHQTGHLFGLLHTYETHFDIEKVDGSNCETAGDKICDTPADGVGLDPDGRNFIPHQSNLMGKDNALRCRFSRRQINSMHSFITLHKGYLH